MRTHRPHTAFDISRRGLVAGLGALPFLRSARARAATPGVLTYGLSSYPPSLLPWTDTGAAAGLVKLLVHRGLVSYDTKGDFAPELAESWTNDTPTSWVFKLRAGATFSNGAPVTSADVKWCIEQIAGAKSTAATRDDFRSVETIETPDARTVRLVTRQPVSTMPIWFANYNMPIVPKDSDLANAIGAGPFVISALERGTSITLVPSAHYYKPGLPKLKQVNIVVYADENLRVAALEAGNVDLIEYVPWQSMSSIAANPKLALDAVDGPFMCLLFNGARGPFGDPRVRLAIAHAIRRDEVVKGAFFGRGSPLAHLPISDQSPFFNADLANGWAYNPELAKKLLADAGVGGGLTCSILSTSQYGMLKDTAEIVQQQLAEIGIQGTLNLPDWPTRVALGNRGQFDIAVHGTAATSNDPDSLAPFIDGSLSMAMSRSVNLPIPRISELLQAGRAEFDTAKRRAIYHQLEQVALEQVPMVGICWRKQGYAMAKQVQGFTNLPGQLTFFSGETIETVTT